MRITHTKLLIALFIIVVSLGIGAWAVNASQQANETKSQTQTDQKTKEPTIGRTDISYTATPGITSLAQLQNEASDVVITESEYGKLVDSIEGHEGGTDGKYWSFYINGEMAQVGADSYVQKEGDIIEWKFQKL